MEKQSVASLCDEADGNPGADDLLLEDTDDRDSLQYSSEDELDAAEEWPRRMLDDVDLSLLHGSISIDGKRKSVRLGNYKVLGSFIDPDSGC